MNNKIIMSIVTLALLIMVSFQTKANNIDAASARMIANSFIKQHSTKAPGSFNAPSTSDIRLVHAEPSSKVAGSNVYYMFNIQGGGFIIIAGDDRASQVLGYSDKGQIDFNNLPEPLQALLYSYKYDIEYIQTHRIADSEIKMRRSLKDGNAGVEPMTTSTWGQESPYDKLTPASNGKQSKVGCAGVCMSQMLYFWKYPLSCGSIEPYFSPKYNDTVPGLPETTFDYSKMLDSYCHWDWDNGRTVQDVYTEEQALEAAKLCRYVGQASQMNYSPNGSGTTAVRKLDAMKWFGYNQNAKTIYLTSYSTEAWEELIREELNVYRPVMYAAYFKTVGHAFIVDGYNNEGFFHLNLGWYGTNDGWYVITAITLVNRYGEHRDYTSRNNMILYMEPPTFCEIKSDEVSAENNLLVLGESLNPQINNVYLFTSHRTLDMMFTLTDDRGRTMATSEPLHVIRHTFDQGRDINLPLMLPAILPSGTYDLQFSYCTGDNSQLIPVKTAPNNLVVIGNLAKYNGVFDVTDVTQAISYVLNGSPTGVNLDVSDVTKLIHYVLNQ